MSGIEFIILGILVVLSSYFSGVETAFISLGRIRLRTMQDKNSKNVELIKKLKDDPHKLLSTLLIGNNFVNIAGSAIATSIAIEMFGSTGIGIATGIMTVVVLIFGEITPKTIAIAKAEKICSFSAPSIYYLQIILTPFIVLSDMLTRKLTSVFGDQKAGPAVTEEEIKSFINMGEEIGSIEKDEKEMINNIFRMNDIELKEIMVPKSQMVVVDETSSIKDATDLILRTGHSRIPVFRDDKDKIVGILYARDLMCSNSVRHVKGIMRSASFVPETKKADSMLQEMQKSKNHMAIAVNEYGDVTGLVTLEDVLEEIVGEIYDETDKVKINIRKSGKNTYLIDGETTIDEIRKVIGPKIKTSKEYNTISGFILAKLARIPLKGEVLEYKKYQLKVLSVDKNRIKKIEMKIS